jgi:nicotinate-nucleotide adenylyltransferase
MEKLPDRWAHIAGCEDSAAELAALWGADEDKTRRAALLHDITKEYTWDEQLKCAESYGIMTDELFRRFPPIAHAITGAAVARHEYGADAEVSGAIRWHTTGHPGMTLIEKIIYLADYIEPNRDTPNLDTLRELARRDLDAAVLRCTKECLVYNIGRTREIHPISLEAYNDMVSNSRN